MAEMSLKLKQPSRAAVESLLGVHAMSTGESHSTTAFGTLMCPIDVGLIIPTLFTSPFVGIALLDERMRYRVVNEALAAMNGLPAKAHTDQPLQYALGSAARKVAEVMDRVLETREPVGNFDLIAKLPGRLDTAHWIESYVPLRDNHGQRTVAVIVLEVTERTMLQQSVDRITCDLQGLQGELRRIERPAPHGQVRQRRRAAAVEQVIHSLGLCVEHLRSLESAPRRDAILHMPLAAATAFLPPQSQQGKAKETLSARELEVLQLVVDGKRSGAIARELGISVRTAETHRARVMMKMGAHSAASLVRLAMKRGLVTA
jgi:DNA-binding CsgD family transcriptional regulator/PAS domain-containing protein